MAPITCQSFYHFIPSAAAGGIFATMFGMLAAGHIFRMVQSKQWFMAAIVVGSGCKSIPLYARSDTNFPDSRSRWLRYPRDGQW
jgi:hypothetical protein